MRKFKILFTLLVLGLFSSNSFACDKSFVSVNYITDLGGGVYQMQVDWCVGTTTSAGGSGGSCTPPDGSTYEMAIHINTGTGINVTSFAPASLISSETGNTASGTITSANLVTYATGSNATLMHDGGASTLPNQYCYSAVVVFSATTLPTSINVRGLEGDCGAGLAAPQYCLESASVPPLTVTPTCAISVISNGIQTSCDPADNTFDQQLEITYSNEPSGGSLVVNGQTFPITGSPQTVTLTELDASGGNNNVTAYFSADVGCSFTATSVFTAPPTCYVGCDFAPTENLVVSSNADYNTDSDFTQLYILTDISGVIITSGSTPNFGNRPIGEYIVYALNYETASPPTLPVNGANISTVTGGCSELSAGLTVGVCLPSVLSTCENSGDDIVIAVGGFNSAAGFNQRVVIVNDVTNIILYNNTLAGDGTVSYTTTSGSGDLLWGNYTAYSVNFEDPATIGSLNIEVGDAWPGIGSFGSACVDVSSAQIEVTAPASCITNTSSLFACTDLNEDVTISVSNFNGNYDYRNYIVVVDNTNTIVAVEFSNEDTDGITTFTAGPGNDLDIGYYFAHSVSIEVAEGNLAYFGLVVGGSWPVSDENCIEVSPSALVEVYDCTILPVGITKFDGVRNENYHTLYWNLGNYKGLESIELQYSKDQNTFNTIKDFSLENYTEKEMFHNNYNLNKGNNYYRLKINYKNSDVKYSNVINLKEKSDEPVFGLFPNPTTNHQFNILSNVDGEFKFVMTDVAGRIVMQQKIIFEIGSNNMITLDNNISKGVYVASFHSDLYPKKNIKVVLD